MNVVWSVSASGNPVMAVMLSNAAGVAGGQLDVSYGRNKGTTAVVTSLWDTRRAGIAGSPIGLAASETGQSRAN